MAYKNEKLSGEEKFNGMKAAAYREGFIKGLNDSGLGYLAKDTKTLDKVARLAGVIADANEETGKRMQPIVKKAMDIFLDKSLSSSE